MRLACRAMNLAQILETLLDVISDALVRARRSNYRLSAHSLCAPRKCIGRNPKTGVEEAPITPRRVLFFRASNVLKQKINKMAGLAD